MSSALNKLALPFAILAFCCWCVYTGGLAAVQANCNHEANFFGNQNYNGSSCGHVLSYWWFIMSMEFVVLLAVIALSAGQTIAFSRLALVGLVTVCFILFIQASQWFTNLLWTTPAYDSMEEPNHRMRTLVAGSIMTAVANGLLLLALGTADPRRELYGANNTAKEVTGTTGNTNTTGAYNTGAMPGTHTHVPGTGTHIPGTHTTNVV
jgi:hypothetical protein